MVTRFPDCVPVLTDGVVTLRAHRVADVPAIVEQCNDPAMVRFTTVPAPYGVSQAHEFIGTHVPGGWEDEWGTRAWAIEAGDTEATGAGHDIPRFAGSIDYRPTPAGVAEVGFGLHPWARGQHVMSRAVRLVCSYAFEQGTESMHWRAMVGNWGSRRVAWACGFRMDGTVRDLLADSRGVHDGWIATLRRGEPMEPVRQWLGTPVLEGGRARLRPWHEDDGPRADQVPDEASRRFMPGFVPTPGTFGDWLTLQRDRSAAGDAVAWCIASRDTDEPLGGITCLRLSSGLTAGTGQVGYWLYPGARGRGAASEALELLVGHAFAPAGAGGLGLHRLATGTDVDNLASQAVLRRAGFVEVGVERSVMAHEDGPPTDGPVFDVLASDDREAERRGAGSVPVLETARLRLRPWQTSDRPRRDQDPDDDSLRFMPAGAQPHHDDFDAWLRVRRRRALSGQVIHWCIADRETDTALGMVQLFERDDPTQGVGSGLFQAEIGYWLFPDVRRHGYAAEALASVVDHAFASKAGGGLGLQRLHAGTDLDNLASQLVLARTGFRRWGVDHQALRRADGSLSDGAYFELLAADRRAGEQAVLDGDRIRLRPFTPRDLPRMAELLQLGDAWPARDSEAREAGESGAAIEADAQEWLASLVDQRLRGAGLAWAVVARGTDRPIGWVSASRLDDALHGDGCEVGYWLEPPSRGNGYPHEGLDLLLTHLFADPDAGGLGLRRVRASASPEDTASQAVLRRAGFRPWGREPDVVAAGSSGGQRATGRVVAPSPDRLRFAVTREDDRAALAADADAIALTPVTIEGRTCGGEPVRLRAWRDDDAGRVVEAGSDLTSQHWLAGLPSPYTQAHAHAYITDSRQAHLQGRTLSWCLADGATDRCVGSIAVMGLGDEDPTSGEIGYWTHPEARRRGAMTEAVRLAVRHAFVPAEDGGLGLRRLTLNVADGNTASAAIASRNGFVEVGRDRRAEVLGDGSHVDLLRFDQLAEEHAARLGG